MLVVTSRSHFPVVFVSWLLWPEDSAYSWENPTVTGCLFLQGRFTFSLSGCQKVFSISSRSADFVFVVIFQAFLVSWTLNVSFASYFIDLYLTHSFIFLLSLLFSYSETRDRHALHLSTIVSHELFLLPSPLSFWQSLSSYPSLVLNS